MKHIAITALIFVGLYNVLLFQTQPGVGTGLFFLGLHFYFFLTKNKDNKNLRFAYYSSITAVFFAFLFALRGSSIVQLVNLATATFFLLIALYFYKYAGNIVYTIPNFLLTPFLVLTSTLGSFFGLFKQSTWVSGSLEKDTTSSLVRGLLIAVPLFIVLLFLLIQADPIFNKLAQDVFTNIGERTIVSLLVFVSLLSFGSIILLEKEKKGEDIFQVSTGKAHELSVITGSVLLLFAVFIAVQFRYLFFTVGERELSQLGIASLTYSEYVRKGFFELLIASVIASGVIIYVLKYLHQLKDRQKQLVQLFSSFLTIETGLLLLSAAKRVFMYADAHGLTRARIFGFVFLIWLAILLVIFLVRIFREIKREQFLASTLIATLFVVMLINVVNIDGIIATRYKPTVNNEVDYYYIASLSTDASDAWAPAIEDAEKTIAELSSISKFSTEDNRKLYWAKATLQQFVVKGAYLLKKYGEIGTNKLSADELQGRKWQSFNMSEYFAYKTMHEQSVLFDRIIPLLKTADVLQERASMEVRQNTPIDRSTKPPLMH